MKKALEQCKRVGAMALALLVCFTLLPCELVAHAEKVDLIAAGYCGIASTKEQSKSLSYTLGMDGVMTISGEGRMAWFGDTKHYDEYRKLCPWNEHTFSDIREVVIGEGVETVSYHAFANSQRLAAVRLPSTLRTIESEAFSGCIQLKSITLPGSITSMGNYCFSECENLQAVKLLEGAATIGAYAFFDCDKLTDVFLPQGLTAIGGKAFRDCDGLVNIVIPEGPAELDLSAFDDCDSLQSISIPASVTNIILGRSDTLPSLNAIHFAGTEEQWNAVTIRGKSQSEYLDSDDYAFYLSKMQYNSVGMNGSGADVVEEEPLSKEYKVIFKINAGVPNDVVEEMYCPEGTLITPPEIPTRQGDYTFFGWYEDEACTQLWDFNTDTVTSGLYLYAGWQEGTTGAADTYGEADTYPGAPDPELSDPAAEYLPQVSAEDAAVYLAVLDRYPDWSSWLIDFDADGCSELVLTEGSNDDDFPGFQVWSGATLVEEGRYSSAITICYRDQEDKLYWCRYVSNGTFIYDKMFTIENGEWVEAVSACLTIDLKTGGISYEVNEKSVAQATYNSLMAEFHEYTSVTGVGDPDVFHTVRDELPDVLPATDVPGLEPEIVETAPQPDPAERSEAADESAASREEDESEGGGTPLTFLIIICVIIWLIRRSRKRKRNK